MTTDETSLAGTVLCPESEPTETGKVLFVCQNLRRPHNKFGQVRGTAGMLMSDYRVRSCCIISTAH